MPPERKEDTMLISTQSRFYLKEKNNNASIVGKINLLLDFFFFFTFSCLYPLLPTKKGKVYLTLMPKRKKRTMIG